MYIANGNVNVVGREIIDTAEILNAAVAVRQETGVVVDPFQQDHFDEERHDFEVIGEARLAGLSRRQQDKWAMYVYDTEGFQLGLPRVEEETRAELAAGGLSWRERWALSAKLNRLVRMREGLAALATENS